MSRSALTFKILAECPVTKARVSEMLLPHQAVDTPVFMPVGTQGTMKGVTPHQLVDMGCQIMLGNTYHLGNRPGCEVLTKAGGLHQFMGWNRALLTDSGGFQMVSLLKLAEITEVTSRGGGLYVIYIPEGRGNVNHRRDRLPSDVTNLYHGKSIEHLTRFEDWNNVWPKLMDGVKFRSPHDDSEMLLTPEQSIAIQNTIGADIIMQLDDVVHVLTTGPRVEEAMHRSVRWLDRCVKAHRRTKEQNLFGIIQGGLQPELRKECVAAMVERDLPGYAIGGLSGGEEKAIFWRIVSLCTDLLPRNKPRYLMGVGFPVDLVVCCALGVDMYDCVYPTRTARCGIALVPWGKVDLKHSSCTMNFGPIDPDCSCPTCRDHTQSSIHLLMVPKETVACSLITIHNLHYMLTLMQKIRQSILENRFVDFVVEFMCRAYPAGDYDNWVVEALTSVNIPLPTPNARTTQKSINAE